MKTSSSSNAALGTIFLLLAIGCGSSTGTSGTNESDGGAGTSANGTGGAGSTGAGGSGNETGGSAGSSSGPGGSAGAAGHGGLAPQDAGSQSDATLVPDVISSGGGCPAAINIADCDARPGCHPVFVDPGTCGCAAPGCCAKYQRCAEGKKAKCTAPGGIGCAIAQPFCEAPYVVSFTNICYEGCVRSTDCAQ